MSNDIIRAIQQRRSIREFTAEEVSRKELEEIMTAGSWAPSGLNNQPWRFVTITGPEVKDQLADTTRYGHIIKAAAALIAVFMDHEAGYNPVKDHQAVGAAVQNMLLAVESLELGAVWLGEILNRKEAVNLILDIPDRFELMAVIAIGHPGRRDQQSSRKPLDELILRKITGDRHAGNNSPPKELD